MKKLFFAIQLLATALAVSAQGEWVSASIGNGATPTSVDLFIKTTTTFDANKIGNLVFTIRIPISGGNNVVVTETFHSPAFTHISFAITKYAVNDGVYYYYLINGTGNVQAGAGTNIIGGDPTPTRVLELSFSGGSNGTVELANIENDLPGNNGALIRPQFYIESNLGEITNLTNMYYGTNGAIPHNNVPPDFDDWVPTAGNVILPVNFTGFASTCNDKGALITWTTASEQNSNRFEVQRSSNGADWTVVGSVAAAGTSSTIRNYQYLDLTGGAAFYRVRQVDNDGQFVYTSIKQTNCKSAQFNVNLYPIPAKDILNVVINSDAAVKTDLQIFDMNGKMVRKIPTQIAKGNNHVVLDVNDLPGGQYMLTSSDPAITINKKFTVNR